MDKKHKFSGRSDSEWLELIHECRTSGLPDKAWCAEQGIPQSTFYNAITRLRKKACDIPMRSSGQMFDLTKNAQEAVRIHLVPDEVVGVPAADKGIPLYLDNSHTIEMTAGKLCVRIKNDADPDLLSRILSFMGDLLC